MKILQTNIVYLPATALPCRSCKDNMTTHCWKGDYKRCFKP